MSSDTESEEDSSAELRPGNLPFERSFRPVVGVLAGRKSDFTDQSETARSNKVRIVSRHPTGFMLLRLSLKTAVLVGADGAAPAHCKFVRQRRVVCTGPSSPDGEMCCKLVFNNYGIRRTGEDNAASSLRVLYRLRSIYFYTQIFRFWHLAAHLRK